MTPFYADDWLTLYGGDCREVLASLPSDSVDCVVTSPPYWGLRDYGTASWEGGDAECDHVDPDWQARVANSPKQQTQVGSYQRQELQTCRKCGATRIDSQLGLERTPEEYVANMVAVFREVRRVLKPSGTCWLNLGDSYAGSWGAQSRVASRSGDPFTGCVKCGRPRSAPDFFCQVCDLGLSATQIAAAPKRTRTGSWVNGRTDLKPKDLVGIPWRVAFALQADGWYLRSDIIWSKPNPMPESVTDRPTKSHEYLFLLTKSARYYFDADAVREEQVKGSAGSTFTNGKTGVNGLGRVSLAERTDNPAGRNIRSVWTIATRPYPGAHFAVFPPELPERCIKAGSSEKGVCPECGAPWERVVERVGAVKNADYADEKRSAMQQGGKASTTLNGIPAIGVTTGWQQTCPHANGASLLPLEPVPAVVLDPFGGSGTVGMVANRLSRRAILIDLNPDYLKQQMRRNAQTPLGLTEGDAA